MCYRIITHKKCLLRLDDSGRAAGAARCTSHTSTPEVLSEAPQIPSCDAPPVLYIVALYIVALYIAALYIAALYIAAHGLAVLTWPASAHPALLTSWRLSQQAASIVRQSELGLFRAAVAPVNATYHTCQWLVSLLMSHTLKDATHTKHTNKQTHANGHPYHSLFPRIAHFPDF